MSDEIEFDPGCLGCLLMVFLTFIGIGLIGFAWKFMVWAWH